MCYDELLIKAISLATYNAISSGKLKFPQIQHSLQFAQQHAPVALQVTRKIASYSNWPPLMVNFSTGTMVHVFVCRSPMKRKLSLSYLKELLK